MGFYNQKTGGKKLNWPPEFQTRIFGLPDRFPQWQPLQQLPIFPPGAGNFANFDGHEVEFLPFETLGGGKRDDIQLVDFELPEITTVTTQVQPRTPTPPPIELAPSVTLANSVTIPDQFVSINNVPINRQGSNVIGHVTRDAGYEVSPPFMRRCVGCLRNFFDHEMPIVRYDNAVYPTPFQ